MVTDFENQVAALDEEKKTALSKVEEEKKTALSEVDEKYGGLIEQSDSLFREQIDAVQSYADKQSEIQQEKTDFAVQQIEQQKDQLGKDYTKEQSAAYVDFKKQTDAHGVNAEKIAAGGMWGSGYSESAQTAMYTEYQRRVATAKASFDQAVVEFDNAITQAQLQNNSVLAEIAFNAFQQKLSLEMQMFTNRNSLLEAQASARAQVEDNYLDVLEQLESNYLKELEQLEENRYNTKPGMEDAFNKWVTYLQNEYKDGYISDETLWQELVDTYGETALKQAGFSNTEPTVGGDVAGSRYGTGFTTENGVFIPTGGVAGHYQPGKTAKGASATESSAQSTGTSIEDQLIKLGMAGISPQELMRRIESGEIIMIEHEDGTYTLKKGTKKNTNAGSALKTNGVDLSNVSKPAASTTFVPNVAPGSDPAQAAGQVFGQWISHILGF